MKNTAAKIVKVTASIISFAAIFFGTMLLGYNVIYMPIFTIAMVIAAMFCVGMAIYVMTTQIK